MPHHFSVSSLFLSLCFSVTLCAAHPLHVLCLHHPSLNTQPDFTPFAEAKWEPWHLVLLSVVAFNTLCYWFLSETSTPTTMHAWNILGLGSLVEQMNSTPAIDDRILMNTMVTKARVAWRSHSKGLQEMITGTLEWMSQALQWKTWEPDWSAAWG